MSSKPITFVDTDTLHFDLRNPRLAEYGINGELNEDEILEILWDAMDVQELVQSISASGFFSNEALIIAEEDGQNVVIEGNRRLAAVKVLINPGLTAEKSWPIPKITDAARKKLKKLPVIIETREEAWRYLGFKHVNGPAKWGSYAKAVYIADVHRKYKIPLVDIANQIGDRHRTVQRLFRGLMVLEQAEREKVFDREDRFNKHLSFSHLYTGLDYEGIAEYIGLSAKEEELINPIPENKISALKDVCVWLYGSRSQKISPVVQSQNPDLRRLNAVLLNRESAEALRSGIPLEKAFEISRPPSAIFESALLAAKRELTMARAYLTTGYDKSEQILKIAGSIANIADDIYTELERKLNEGKEKKRRISE